MIVSVSSSNLGKMSSVSWFHLFFGLDFLLSFQEASRVRPQNKDAGLSMASVVYLFLAGVSGKQTFCLHESQRTCDSVNNS